MLDQASRALRDTLGRFATGIGILTARETQIATLAMIEAIVRLIPGVIVNPESLAEESHSQGNEGLLEYPVYTKPPSWRGLDVPDVLFSVHPV